MSVHAANDGHCVERRLSRFDRGAPLTEYFALQSGSCGTPFRFALDFLRVDDAVYAGLTPGHYASLCTLGIGALLLLNMRRPALRAPPLS